MTRRFFALATATAAAVQARSADPARLAAEAARAEISRRFLDPLGTIYHYTGLKGEVVRPTAEECAANKPSAMSWSTPIEDGAFFGALYLDGLILRWKATKTRQAAADARRMVDGLIRLARVSSVPGFIARGVAADGRGHYSASSEDQTFPWFYGLWRYLRSGLATSAERATIQPLLVSTALAIESNGWRIPCDPVSFGFRGSYVRPTGYDSARLLSLHRMLFDLTGDPRWMDGYLRCAGERPGSSMKTRVELASGGIEFAKPGAAETKFWTTSMGVAALRALVDLETDPVLRAQYQKGLDASAAEAAPHIVRYRNYDAASRKPFDIDWRFLNKEWKPQASCDEAFVLAQSLLPLWAKTNPRSIDEDQTMREPLFAAWIVTLSGDRALIGKHRDEIREALRRFRWNDLYTSTFFVAVNIYYQGAHSGL